MKIAPVEHTPAHTPPEHARAVEHKRARFDDALEAAKRAPEARSHAGTGKASPAAKAERASKAKEPERTDEKPKKTAPDSVESASEPTNVEGARKEEHPNGPRGPNEVRGEAAEAAIPNEERMAASAAAKAAEVALPWIISEEEASTTGEDEAELGETEEAPSDESAEAPAVVPVYVMPFTAELELATVSFGSALIEGTSFVAEDSAAAAAPAPLAPTSRGDAARAEAPGSEAGEPSPMVEVPVAPESASALEPQLTDASAKDSAPTLVKSTLDATPKESSIEAPLETSVRKEVAKIPSHTRPSAQPHVPRLEHVAKPVTAPKHDAPHVVATHAAPKHVASAEPTANAGPTANLRPSAARTGTTGRTHDAVSAKREGVERPVEDASTFVSPTGTLPAAHVFEAPVMAPIALDAVAPVRTVNVSSVVNVPTLVHDVDASDRLVRAAESTMHKRALADVAQGTLSVPELGRVEVEARARTHDRPVFVDVRVEQAATRELLLTHAPELREHVREAATDARVAIDGRAMNGDRNENSGSNHERAERHDAEEDVVPVKSSFRRSARFVL